MNLFLRHSLGLINEQIRVAAFSDNTEHAKGEEKYL